ncbi:isoaspartyl peptidase/L-asparaginase [Natronomonas marina]|jgi:beta-aspartyl-peptidase (threonine type)|uniref:isoaspartyl peptidase/L-asparaginase n=1 Tax=Natronomonas marina TaxID=2961939 RepID=UPI0020C9B842|nr:isoaspartyl peptidase/L-asparaginase [Natronomonas marina]
MRVIAHGGAGTPPEESQDRQAALEAAVDAGTGADGPTDAVVETVRVLESDPRFNAGVGGAVQSDGHVRTDAGLMTDDREAGAACGMPGVEHAIDVARAVKEETPHVLVAGVHAVDLAAAVGVETGVDLLTDRTRKRWDDLDEYPEGDQLAHAEWVTERFGGDPDSGLDAGDHDTVGAVATDGDRVAAATSTGGRWLALAGRVGDVPQVGSGFYCAPAGGASATGAGEDIARTTLSRRAVDRLADGVDADAAAETAIEEFGDLVAGSAGVILLTPDGDAGAAFNSDAMQTVVAGDV